MRTNGRNKNSPIISPPPCLVLLLRCKYIYISLTDVQLFTLFSCVFMFAETCNCCREDGRLLTLNSDCGVVTSRDVHPTSCCMFYTTRAAGPRGESCAPCGASGATRLFVSPSGTFSVPISIPRKDRRVDSCDVRRELDSCWVLLTWTTV